MGGPLQLTYQICKLQSCQAQEGNHSGVLMDSRVPESSYFLTQCSTKIVPSSTDPPRGGKGAMSVQTKPKIWSETID